MVAPEVAGSSRFEGTRFPDDPAALFWDLGYVQGTNARGMCESIGDQIWQARMSYFHSVCLYEKCQSTNFLQCSHNDPQIVGGMCVAESFFFLNPVHSSALIDYNRNK